MHISHNNVRQFAEDVVNLPSNHARKYREQVNDLRQRLEEHIKDYPDYHLKRMMLSGSLAKRTSLRSISDADVALYVESDDAPEEMMDFLDWLADELATLYRHINRQHIEPKTYSVSISFKGRGLDVDVVPIYWINNQWDGDLVSQDDGSRLRTNIPKHLEFMKVRHKRLGDDFRQVVRLLKFWANQQKERSELDDKGEPKFRFKSFMIELVVSHLADKGRISLGSYPGALRQFFDYLVMSNLDEVISFDDYGQGSASRQNKPINIFDPVNPENNVASRYTQQNKDLILEAAMDAADAIEYASLATTKDEALRQWRRVFGTIFKA